MLLRRFRCVRIVWPGSLGAISRRVVSLGLVSGVRRFGVFFRNFADHLLEFVKHGLTCRGDSAGYRTGSVNDAPGSLDRGLADGVAPQRALDILG